MDKEALSKLIKDGKTHLEIAAIFGCTRAAVSYAAKSLGLRSNSAQKPIDVELLRKEVDVGTSFSVFSKKYNHTLSAVSKVAKKHGIAPPGDNHIEVNLPDQEIYDQYIGGSSIYVLHRKYKVATTTIQQHLKRIDKDIIFRSMDEAKEATMHGGS